MKKIITLISCLISFSCLFSRGWKGDDTIAFRDSLMRKVEHLPADTSRLFVLLDAAYLHQNPPYNVFFARHLYEEACKQQNIYYENLGAYYLAVCYDKKHDLDSITFWVDKLQELASKIGKYDYYLEQKAAVSRVLASKKMNEKAVFVAREVLKESEERHCNNGIVAAYNSLGCTYATSNRPDEALAALLKGYRACRRYTKLGLHIDILSRLSRQYAYRAKWDSSTWKRDSVLFYLKKMDDLLGGVVEKEPKTLNNWRDVMVDCQIKYVNYYMNKKNYPKTIEALEKSKALLTPEVDSVYWLNIQLMEMQYYARTQKYDQGLALIDQVAPFVEKGHIDVFETLIFYKSLILRDKGDWNGGINTLKLLLHKQDSLNIATTTSQLEQVKEKYQINELLMEKQKIANMNYLRAITILSVLLVLMLLFYLYTGYLSKKIAVAEKEAIRAAELSHADNLAKERLKLEISHDIRTPLNAVVGFAEILADADCLDEETKSTYNKIVQENATQLLDYVNNILELSRLESGKIKYVEERCDFVSLFRAVIEEANKNAQNCVHAELRTDLETQTVRTDRARLLSLLESLTVSTVDTEFYHSDITVKRIDEKSLLLVTVVNTPLAKERFENKTAMIRNEINAHFIHYFGGYYKVDEQAKQGPSVTFTYPYDDK